MFDIGEQVVFMSVICGITSALASHAFVQEQAKALEGIPQGAHDTAKEAAEICKHLIRSGVTRSLDKVRFYCS